MGGAVREQVLHHGKWFRSSGCWYRMPNCRFVTRLWVRSNLSVVVWRAVKIMRRTKWISLYKTPG